MSCPSDIASTGYVDSRLQKALDEISQLKAELSKELSKKVDTNDTAWAVSAVAGLFVLTEEFNSFKGWSEKQINYLLSDVAQLIYDVGALLGWVNTIFNVLATMATLSIVNQIQANLDALRAFTDALFGQILNFIASLKTDIAKAQSTADQAQNTADQAQNTADKALNEAESARDEVSSLNDKVDQNKAELEAKIASEINSLKQSIQQSINNLDIKINGIDNKHDNNYDSLNQALTDLQSDLNTKISNLQDLFSQRLTEIQNDFNDKLASLEDKLTQQLQQLESDLLKQIEALKQEFLMKLNSIEWLIDLLEAKVNELESYINEVKSTLERYGLSIDNLVSENSKQWSDISKLFNEIDKLTNNINNKIVNLETTITNNITNITNTINNIVETIDVDLSPITDKLDQINPKLDQIPDIKMDLTALGLTVATLTTLMGTMNNGITTISGNLPGTCRFHEDTISPQIKADTAYIRGVQAGHVALDTTTAAQVTNVNATTQTINTTTQATQSKLFTFIDETWAKFSKGFDFLYKNLGVDRALNVINSILLFHNAMMLSNAVWETLGDTVDISLKAFGIKWEDQEGNQLEFTETINKEIKEIVVNLIGEEQYKTLATTWNAFSKIYQASANLLYSVRSLFDETMDLAQNTYETLAKWMNVARNDGLVQENSYKDYNENYPAQSKYRKAVQKYTDGIGEAEDSLDNLAMITGNVVNVKDEFKEVKENKDEFNKTFKEEGEKLDDLWINEKDTAQIAPTNDPTRDDFKSSLD